MDMKWAYAALLAVSMTTGCASSAPSVGPGQVEAPMLDPSPRMADARGSALVALDTDGDGTVTLTEVRTARAARFSELDVDGDGALSTTEASGGLSPFDGGGQAGGQYAFLAADADFNGSLTQDEFVEAAIPALARIDTNMDSRLTSDEFAAAIEQLRARRAQAQ